MNYSGNATLSGTFSLRKTSARQRDWRKRLAILRWRMGQWARYGWREIPLWVVVGLLPLLRLFIPGLNVLHSSLRLKVTKADGTVWDYGRIGRHLVVTAGKNYLAACMDNTSEPESLKFHGFGTGTNAAGPTDTALQTELTTQYASDNTRPTGTQAHGTPTYTTVGTLAPDAGAAVTEWGLFNQAANSGGTLFDRQVFSAVNLVSGDSLAATYVLTFS